MKMGVVNIFFLVILAVHGFDEAAATFHFPSFDGAKPLMAALGNLQQYFGLPSMSSRVVKSAPPESHPGYASATVGYGTILKNPPVLKPSPYGAPRPVLRRPIPPQNRPAATRPVVKYAPYKGGYYPKFKPQPVANYEKLKPAVVDYKPAKEHHFKNPHPYEYLKSEVLHGSYTTAPEEASKHNPVIVHQSVRPPIQFYQQPHVATSHQVSNLNSKTVHQHHQQQQQQQSYQPVAQPQKQVQHQHQQSQQPHHRSDNLVDFSRPDPMFAAASMGSEWKPISPPVGVVNRVYQSSDRRADHVAKQVEPPPTLKVQMMQEMPVAVQPSKKMVHVDRSDHMVDFVDDQPSEEIVSAVVFVKKTTD